MSIVYGEFFNGELISAIHLSGGGLFKAGENCDSIIVRMESGQMAAVPWFEIYQDGVRKSKWNGALVEGVVYYE